MSAPSSLLSVSCHTGFQEVAGDGDVGTAAAGVGEAEGFAVGA